MSEFQNIILKIIKAGIKMIQLKEKKKKGTTKRGSRKTLFNISRMKFSYNSFCLNKYHNSVFQLKWYDRFSELNFFFLKW